MDNKIYIYIHGYAEDKLKEVILNAIDSIISLIGKTKWNIDKD